MYLPTYRCLQAHIFTHARTQCLLVMAMREISQGEEVTVTYKKGYAPLEQRQADLRRDFNFCCACAVCTREPGRRASDDFRLTRVQTLLDKVPDVGFTVVIVKAQPTPAADARAHAHAHAIHARARTHTHAHTRTRRYESPGNALSMCEQALTLLRLVGIDTPLDLGAVCEFLPVCSLVCSCAGQRQHRAHTKSRIDHSLLVCPGAPVLL